MRSSWLRIAPIAACALFAGSGLSGATDDRLQALRDAFSTAHGEGFKIERMASYVAQVFQQIDVNGDGLEQQEIDRAIQKVNAQRRSQIISQYLRYDLDGNFEITADEVVSAALDRGLTASQTGEGTNRAKRRQEEALKKIMRDDQNGDGVITLDELKTVKIDTERRDRSLSHVGIAQALLAFDQTGDGRVTQIEAFAALSQAFANDDIASAEVAVPHGCKVSGVDPESAVVLIGAYEGESVSTVSVAGQDEETSTAAIFVEDGSQKLTLFLTSYDAMVWRIEGATERVAQVVLTSRNVNPADRMTAAGVVGIDREKVSFIAGRQCLPHFHKANSSDEIIAGVKLRQLIGRDPDVTIGTYAANTIHVPSGLMSKTKGSFKIGNMHPAFASRLKRFSPGGIVEIDVSRVVSDTKAEAYQVLPQEAGLVQLLSEGALIQDRHDSFQIVKKIRYPAGLSGAHRVKFLLRKGVPEPEGNPGHSCVFSEEHGELIDGMGC